MKNFAFCKQPDKMKYPLTGSWRTAMLFALVFGCANPAGIEEKNRFSSPQDVVENLSQAYAEQNLQRYLGSFSNEIEFGEGVAYLWGKEREEQIHRKMFTTTESINLTLKEFGTVLFTETNKTALYSYRLEVQLLSGEVMDAAGAVQLEFSKRESGAWQIRAFNEIKDRLTRITAGVSAPEDSLDYFPLRVGNTWTYEEQFAPNVPDVELVITDSLMLQGNFYHRVQNGEGLLYSNFVRMDSIHQLRPFFTDDSSEQIVFDFAAEVGDSLIFTQPNAPGITVVELISHKDSLAVPAGTFQNILEFFITDFSSGSVFIYEFAANVGIIRQRGTNQVLALKSALVNGTKYPVITSVETSYASWTQIKSSFR